jgi:hypothetical protein
VPLTPLKSTLRPHLEVGILMNHRAVRAYITTFSFELAVDASLANIIYGMVTIYRDRICLFVPLNPAEAFVNPIAVFKSEGGRIAPFEVVR